MMFKIKHLILPIRKMTTIIDDVLFEVKNNKAIITLNRPEALNALNLSMIRKISLKLLDWQKDNKLDFIIIRGSGEKAFCAGGDVKALADSGKGDNVIQKQFFKEEYMLNYAIGTSKIPWISLINGITMGGGVGLSVHGKYTIATEKTLFAMPETAIGLFPDVGGGYFLPRLKSNLGIFLGLTGFRLKGSDVLSAGIATHFIDSKKILDLIDELIKLKIPVDDHQLNTIFSLHQKNSLDKFNKEFILENNLHEINETFSGSNLENIFEKLKSLNTYWSNKQLQILSKMSPISMKVTLEQLNRGSNKSLDEVLKMEYRIGQRIMAGKDFYEGIRAVLVDKDNKPCWQPKNIEDVSQQQVLAHFQLLSEDEELFLP